MDMNEPYGEKASRLLGDASSWVRTDDPAFAKAACDLLGSDSNIFLPRVSASLDDCTSSSSFLFPP